MVRKYGLIEKCTLIRERFIAPPISTTHRFIVLPVHDRDVTDCHWDPPCSYYLHYLRSRYIWKRNQGFWKTRESRQQNKRQILEVTVTSQTNLRSSAMAWHGMALNWATSSVHTDERMCLSVNIKLRKQVWAYEKCALIWKVRLTTRVYGILYILIWNQSPLVWLMRWYS